MFRCLTFLGVTAMVLALAACWGCTQRPAKKAEPVAKDAGPKQPAKPAGEDTTAPKQGPEQTVGKDAEPAETKAEETAAEADETAGRGGRAVGRVFRRVMEGGGRQRPGSLSGMSRSAPRRVYPPAIDANEAGKKAVAQYDLDGDGAVGGKELDKAPALKAAIKNLDRNHDGKVTAEEVAARVKAWQRSRVGLISMACYVTLDGKPLAGATVTYEPETFLGANIKPASGTTDQSGVANLSIPIQPDEPGGVACGLYRVQVSKQAGGKDLIPARYNAQTTLGLEVAIDAEGMQEGMFRFVLSSK